ncbi:hypothetical protein ACFX2J_027436 [Malus domestica]
MLGLSLTRPEDQPTPTWLVVVCWAFALPRPICYKPLAYLACSCGLYTQNPDSAGVSLHHSQAFGLLGLPCAPVSAQNASSFTTRPPTSRLVACSHVLGCFLQPPKPICPFSALPYSRYPSPMLLDYGFSNPMLIFGI